MKIAISIIVSLLILGCSEDAKEKKDEIVEHTQKSVKEITSDVVQEVKEMHEDVTDTIKDTSKDIKEKVKETKKEISKKIDKVKEVEPKKKEVAAVDGSKVYQKCMGCHGSSGEKKALNKSQIIKGWDKQKVITAIDGYKDGTYGSSMKSVMKSQVSKLSDAEVDAVATYISTLK